MALIVKLNFSILDWVLKPQESRVLVLKILASVVQQAYEIQAFVKHSDFLQKLN